MIGALYKKIILVFFIINVYIFPNTLDKQSYILPDFIPIQESRTSIGIKLFSSIDSENDMSLEKSLLLTNWFTNNLYMAGSISSMGYNNDISLRYTASIGYAYNINYNKFKNNIKLNQRAERILDFQERHSHLLKLTFLPKVRGWGGKLGAKLYLAARTERC